MGLLVGLPLKLFHMLFVIVRLAWPLLLVALLLYIRRRRSGQSAKPGGKTRRQTQEPTFSGPVYTVDYQEVDDAEDTP